MFTAADVIAHLGQRRRLRSIRPEVPGQLPPGWQDWLDAMAPAAGRVTGPQPQAIVDALAERPLLAAPRRSAQLTRWQAFGALWRQQWQPPMREERGTRWFAAAFSGALHCVLVVMLLWLAYVRIEPVSPAPPGENVVQVEFIGRGAPREEGGGAPASVRPEIREGPAGSRAAATRPPTPRRAAAATAVPRPPAPPVAPTPVPPAPQPPSPQPLQVTEVEEPDTDFVLPPPRPREATLPEPQLAVPDLVPPTPRITEVEAPARVVLQAERPALQVQSRPQLRAEQPPEPEPEPEPAPEPAERMPQAQARQVRAVAGPELQVPEVRAQVREIPMPDLGAAPTPGKDGASAPSPGISPAASAAAGGAPAAASGVQPAAAAGAGPGSTSKPGAWPTPEQGDDWGASARNRPGGKPAGERPGTSGIFGADGRPLLVDAPAPGRNAPGTVEQRIADLDRAGTWLKRPPYDYTPTAFDKYWRPRETLLQEWVRKGIKKLSIPIPGTDKKLECVVSLLQFGGGCGIADPNRNEQPATARPPPDIPFKPELQDDNGSVRP